VDFHPALATDTLDAVFSKGEYSAAYSGFEGFDDSGAGLADWLGDKQINAVDIVGLATDHCVVATALDAQASGFTTRVLLRYTAGVSRCPDDRGRYRRDHRCVRCGPSRMIWWHDTDLSRRGRSL
jgi:nicotinamidase-related amidase